MGKHDIGYIKVRFTEEQTEKIASVAQVYGLENAGLIKLLILGILDQGGGQLDKTIQRGEALLPKPPRKRAGRNFKSMWKYAGEHTYEWGDWVLFNIRTKGANTVGAKDDQNQWWHLTHRHLDGIMVPLSFNGRLAHRLAVEWIEKNGQAAIKQQLLASATPESEEAGWKSPETNSPPM